MANTKTKTKKKAQTTPEFRLVTPRQRASNRIVRSSMTQMSVDPFKIGNSTNQGKVILDFASQEGRRGAEVSSLISGPKSTTITNSTVARNRSRHAVLTNSYAKRAIDILVSNVVGTGHTLQAASPNEEFNKQAEELFHEEFSFEIDPAGKLNFSSLEALVFRSMLEGGDCFGRFRIRRPEDNLAVPLQIQVLEAEQVPPYKNGLNGNNRIIGGIEFTPFGQVARYHILPEHPGEFTTFESAARRTETIPVDARQIMHIHDVRRPNEVRGLPVLAQSLIQLSDLDRYLDAELVRKKAAALIGGFITYQPGMEGLNPFINSDEDDEDEEIEISAMEPGTFPVLPQGYDVKFSDPADVGINFNTFMKQQLQMLSASVNILYEQLTGDYAGANDRTVRAALMEFKRIAINYQKNVLVHQFCKPVYKEFIRVALLSGALTLPEGMTVRQAQRSRWIADPWGYLNPLQEVNTQIKQIRAGLKSRTDIVTEMGEVPSELDAKIRADKDREEQLGLVFDTNAEVLSSAGTVHGSDPEDILNDEVEDDEVTSEQ